MKRRFLSLATVSTLLLGAFFCVGMGMEMTVGAQMQDMQSHACCDGGDAEQDKENGPDCCSFIPGALAKVWSLDGPEFSRIAAAKILIVESASVEAVHSSRAPPGYAPPQYALSSPRAPPAV